ncbi:MAG: AraC family transcriptional regulator, partial [Mucilaginibacter sp.]
MESFIMDVTNAKNKPLRSIGFKVSRSNVPKSPPTTLGRRHFYKIVLVKGSANIQYGDQAIQIDGLSLFFANPEVPYSVEIVSELQTGYSCVFSRDFIKPIERSESLQNSPLFKISNTPAFQLSEKQYSKLSGIFELMIADSTTDYLYVDDLMRNYLQLILHEALRLRPAENFIQFNNAALRITKQFLDLLERQFPVEHLTEPVKLKTAQDFADRLAIHANYLNRAVKGVTGKSTTMLIAERTTTEATALLQHTDWSVSDIAYALGFEYPNYFSNFFKKATG